MIFVDTGAWFASVVSSDKQHQKAMTWVQNNQESLLTTDYVIDETLTLLSTTYQNYSKGEQKRKKLANPVQKEKIKGNIWQYVVGKKAEDQEAKAHPAPFPCALARDHILSWTNKGDIVLDPMCGSGTTSKSAYQLERFYIGIDISEEYCNLARERINNSKLQLTLTLD